MFVVSSIVLVVTALLAVQAQDCPSGGEVYARGISDDGKAAVIHAHNSHRLDLANGRVDGQPRAVNMKRMSYDDALGEEGRVVSDTCEMNHIIAQDDRWSWVGQNLYISWSSEQDDSQNWQEAVDSWFDEEKDFVYPNTSNGVTGHYTQVAWADSHKVGCDFISFYDVDQPDYPYAKLYTCNYGPGGNFNDEAPYKTGKSGCENLC